MTTLNDTIGSASETIARLEAENLRLRGELNSLKGGAPSSDSNKVNEASPARANAAPPRNGKQKPLTHELNNLLMSILGYIDMARRLSPSEPIVTDSLTGAERATRRAAELCRQIAETAAASASSARPSDITEKTNFYSPRRPSAPWRGSGNILIADDNPAVRDLLCTMASRCGFTVIEAEDGRKALEIFQKRRDEILCVILDMDMPNLDGEKTLDELRNLQPDLPVVVSSGLDDEEVLERFEGKNISGFMLKPYHYTAFIATMKKVLKVEEESVA